MPILETKADNGIASVVISNLARRNALDLEIFESLAALWPRLAADASVRAVLIRGDGEEAFCAGADLNSHLDCLEGIDELIDRALLKTGFFPKPIVAAITGSCVAGGLELALACDIRIAAEEAIIGLPEVRWGIVPSGGGAMKLIDQIGYAHAMDLLLTGRLISGAEAEKIGLVSKACPRDRVLDTAFDRVNQIASNSPTAVFATKRLALNRRIQRYRAHEAEEREIVASVRRSGDPEEGKQAFLEKRAPRFYSARDSDRWLDGTVAHDSGPESSA